ncbi:hypothetical protein BTM25_42460 [Actinomadura rubteroloni]|uniref:DUF998 domain-containing protein n=1 Tax=Actinomadura rubteroloni TaxID=1926885 RepID=A0A2P4UKN6_9ACTN|nr:DUF998 domain-containing protein [Actinomadura rubteroloni]POM25598.1 hypothetical protein BTM25_42460 [Actinomadura rubteroloni]
MRRGNGPGRAPLFVALLLGASAVTYASFALETWLSPKLDAFNGYASELSAVDQPFHSVYNMGDLVTGVMVIISAVTALLTLRRRPIATAGWMFLGLFGVSTIGDASFPLDCAPSLETWCALRERAGTLSFAHNFHEVTSTAVITMAVIALFLLGLAARRYDWWPPLARWAWPLALVEVVASASTLVAMVLGRWLGIIQRVQISILCLMLLLVAWTLLADRLRPSAPDAERPREKAGAASWPRCW